MTDIMSFTTPEERLPGAPRVGSIDLSNTILEQRVRDLELVCRAQQKALNFALVRWMKASDQRDLKEKIWPDLNAADMILDD